MGRQCQLQNHPQQVGLCAYLWQIVLIVLIRVEKKPHLQHGWYGATGLGAELCNRSES